MSLTISPVVCNDILQNLYSDNIKFKRVSPFGNLYAENKITRVFLCF